MIAGITEKAAQGFGARKDAVISQAITNKIGNGWSVEDLAAGGRLEIVEHQNGSQTVMLDGDRLLAFYPESNMVSDPDEAGITTLTVKQQYRALLE